MEYNEISGQVSGKKNSLITSATSVEGVPLENVWSGSAYNTLNGYLNIAMNKLWIEIGNLNTFTNALNQLEKYKSNKEKIETLTAQMNSLPDKEKYDSERASLAQQIKTLTSENETLRAAITSALSTITATSTEINSVTFTFGPTDYTANLNLDYDVYEILAAYQNRWGDADGITDPTLVKLGDGVSLYKYYDQIDENGNVIEGSGEAYIKSVLAKIQSEYSGREAAVNSALAILKLAADKGVKLDYQHKGTGANPYVSTDSLASGIDCNPFASWVLDKGTPTGFQWRPVGEFTTVGEKIEDWTKAQPGDVFVIADGTQHHVGIIIENDPENGVFITAEARGDSLGIVLDTRTYSSMGGYQIRDMTNVYNGTENTDRPVFSDKGREGREDFTITV